MSKTMEENKGEEKSTKNKGAERAETHKRWVCNKKWEERKKQQLKIGTKTQERSEFVCKFLFMHHIHYLSLMELF
jgi:hypothetical protein